MAVNWRKVLAIVAILVIVALVSFLLFWFLGRTTEEPVRNKLVEFNAKNPKTTSYNGDVLPTALRNECGHLFPFNQSAIGSFVAPGGSFGWNAYFDYSMKEGSILDGMQCGGTIINQRYIMTAAHCVFGTETQKLKLEKIRLGLTSITNATNCDQTGLCAQAIWVGIEEIIPHPSYDPISKTFKNDIALIRVDQDIQFSNYIKPICLRDKTVLDGNKYLSGWPKNIASNTLEPKKYVVVLTYLSGDKCSAHFTERYKVDKDKTQMCATGDETKEFCIQNSGNVLAGLSFDRWYAEGIDSFGKRCGEKAGDSVGIYTEIAHFYPWIKANIKK